MGNTILAHALYSCNQINLDLDQFFSDTGDAHAIAPLNRSELTVEHLIEFPNTELSCVLEITTTGWWEVLRIKMSYSKWWLETPDLHNFSRFFSYVTNIKSESLKLWKEFYQSVRDPSWPDCDSPADVQFLPVVIQEEINKVYVDPDFSLPSNSNRLAEWLSKVYYDNFSSSNRRFDSVPSMDLGQYINGDYEELINVCCKLFDCEWDHARSKMFYDKAMEVNLIYLSWLDAIKSATDSVINNRTVDEKFDLWEQSLIIAKACESMGLDPLAIDWNSNSCDPNENNLYLTKFTRRQKNGETGRSL